MEEEKKTREAAKRFVTSYITPWIIYDDQGGPLVFRKGLKASCCPLQDLGLGIQRGACAPGRCGAQNVSWGKWEWERKIPAHGFPFPVLFGRSSSCHDAIIATNVSRFEVIPYNESRHFDDVCTCLLSTGKRGTWPWIYASLSCLPSLRRAPPSE